MRITLLGTGTSHGVPMLDCLITNYATCPAKVCLRARYDPSYRRTRASILVQTPEISLLIDTSQDFREQMLANRIKRIDAVLYTHGHADHIYGLPDLRSYSQQQGGPIPLYGSQETLSTLQNAFSYIFSPPEYRGGGIPQVSPHLLEEEYRLGDITIVPLPVVHGPLNGCQGYRLNDVAYIPDVKVIPPSTLERLQGVKVLILNCLRHRPHQGHLSLEESLAYAHAINPERCFLTHIAHDIDYRLETPHLPEWIRFGYDGQVIIV